MISGIGCDIVDIAQHQKGMPEAAEVLRDGALRI